MPIQNRKYPNIVLYTFFYYARRIEILIREQIQIPPVETDHTDTVYRYPASDFPSTPQQPFPSVFHCLWCC